MAEIEGGEDFIRDWSPWEDNHTADLPTMKIQSQLVRRLVTWRGACSGRSLTSEIG